MKINKNKLLKMSQTDLIGIILNLDNNLKVCEENYSRLNYEIIDSEKKIKLQSETIVNLLTGYGEVYNCIASRLTDAYENMIKNEYITFKGIQELVELKEIIDTDIDNIRKEYLTKVKEKKENE